MYLFGSFSLKYVPQLDEENPDCSVTWIAAQKGRPNKKDAIGIRDERIDDANSAFATKSRETAKK